MVSSLVLIKMLRTPRLHKINSLILLACCLACLGFTKNKEWTSLLKYPFPNSIIKALTNQFSDVESVDDLDLSCTNKTDFSEYNNHNRYYLVDASIDNVWNSYINTDLKTAWSGKGTKYGFAYNKQTKEIFAEKNNSVFKPQVGLGFFIELKISKLLKIPVALEVSQINQKNKIIQFTYLKRNKSNGRQTIVFKKYGNNQTLILHQTYFKSNRQLRDKYFYSPYHTHFIDQFHGIILKESATFKTVSQSKMKKDYSASLIELLTAVKKLENRLI